MATSTPTRRTSERELDRWNTALRASPVYQTFMREIGNDGGGRVKLSRRQQTALENRLRQTGVQIPSGMHIDQGGNLNQKNRLGRNVAIGAAVTGAALTGFGLAGMGPFSGLGAGTAAGAGAAGAAGAAGGTAAGAGAAGAAGAGAAGAAGAAASGGFPWGDVVEAGLRAAPAIAGLAGGAGRASTSPEAMALIDQQRQRMEQANPVYESVLRLAMSRLPTGAREGLSVPGYEQVLAGLPPVEDGDYSEDPATRNLLRTQLARSQMSDPVLQAVLRLAQSRMPVTARG